MKKPLNLEEFLDLVRALLGKGWEPFIDEHSGIRVRHSVHTNDGSTMSPDVSPLQAVCLEVKNFRCNAGHGGAVGAAVLLDLDPKKANAIIEAIHPPTGYNLQNKIRRQICEALGL